jgi:hypothetical protein
MLILTLSYVVLSVLQLDHLFQSNFSLQDHSFMTNLNTSANLSLLDSPGIRSSNPSVLNSKNEMMGDLYGPTQPNKRGGNFVNIIFCSCELTFFSVLSPIEWNNSDAGGWKS